MTAERPPLDWVDVIIVGMNDPGPFMNIVVQCKVCGDIISEHGFDARDAGEGDRASNAVIEDAKAAVAHRDRHEQ